jgi:hypothetical protein
MGLYQWNLVGGSILCLALSGENAGGVSLIKKAPAAQNCGGR